MEGSYGEVGKLKALPHWCYSQCWSASHGPKADSASAQSSISVPNAVSCPSQSLPLPFNADYDVEILEGETEEVGLISWTRSVVQS